MISYPILKPFQKIINYSLQQVLYLYKRSEIFDEDLGN